MPDLPVLDPVELRVLGALLEKQRTVPDSYPLSLNSLRTACNQSTSRDPVVAYDEATILDALNRLRDRELVRFVKPTGLRVVKYHQRLEEQLGLDAPGTALVAVLLLRGAQTRGELRPRTERLHAFADREAVEAVLQGAGRAGTTAGAGAGTAGRSARSSLDPPARRRAAARGRSNRSAAVDREQVLASGGLARDRKVAAEYDRLAEAYAIALGDDLEAKPFDRWFLEELADSAPGQGLDVGCGPGQVAGLLAGLDMEMTGLDISPAMLDAGPGAATGRHFRARHVRRAADAAGQRPARSRLGPGDGLVCVRPSRPVGDRPAVSALAKVLCRGGYLAIATHVGDEVRHPGELFGEPTELDFMLHDPEVIIAAVEAAGLIDIEWYIRSPRPTRRRPGGSISGPQAFLSLTPARRCQRVVVA